MNATEVFAGYRPLLFTLAYEILGSASDAEDVVQESYLRWIAAGDVTHLHAYLVQVVTRQALNALRASKRRREDYVGNWLPEPIQTESDVGEDAVLAESVSMAMLLVLETLSPDERVVFVLHEVFGYSYPEIAPVVGKSDTAVRQIAHRAREHVQARRRRFTPDKQLARTTVTRFLRAAHTGDIDGLVAVMAPDIVALSDGGGKVSAARRPVVGPRHVAQFMAGLAQGAMAEFDISFGSYNSMPAVSFLRDGALDSILLIELTDGLITALYAMRNPDKLRDTATTRSLTRQQEN
ncbi:RNA polymerase sigma-70 factor [Mycolicibacterium peregrinum]|uniref:RNA polymerase sigma-70 factor n=1 Tax=Mycolicibacterium peregrinum TaxID=43304 RepID=UPI0006D85BA0|nr:RNA polymerase sigma-70 factor [Mycolicibacterium peregrinum]MCV7201832.1 RNA polymerase sigma-70 factor [Mycolicibacterium peregrinum]ORW61584.1 RNA polymerase subunit sigma-24 [Mycolicibacterium peregrinum]